MKKKVLLIILVIVSIFMLGCSAKEDKQTLSNNTTSQESIKQSNSNTDNSSQNNKSDAGKSNENNDNKNDTSKSKNEELFYGEWVIEKTIGYSKAGTYSTEDIKKIVGKKLSFSKEKSSCFGDDVSYLNNIVENPNYKKSKITPSEFETNFAISLSSLSINSKDITEIEAVDNKGFSLCTFFIKDDNTLILYGGGNFFELSRVK